MEFKIDTKEKFSVATLKETDITRTIAAEMSAFALDQMTKTPKNIIFNLENCPSIDEDAAISLTELYSIFLEKGVSLVFCNLQLPVKAKLDDLELTDILNITPTESEAWDIVQMEEIEREMFDE